MKEIELNKQLPVITMNFDEVKTSLLETTEKYKNIVVTEDSLKDCKATQKELAGIRNKLDGYRKEVKKEMEKPIKEFDGQCKELIQLISDAEAPIKEGIKVFDDKKREEKRKFAELNIFEICQQLGLEKKYADQLTVLDKYLNLTVTKKAVVEDIGQRATALKQQQNMDIAKMEIVKSSIDNAVELANKDLKTPLNAEDFYKYIECWDTKRIIMEINDRADLVREAEKPKQVEETVKEKVEMPIDISNKEAPKEPQLYIRIEVKDSLERMKVLSNYLKENGYNYNVLEQRKC